MIYYRINQLEKDTRVTGATRRKLVRIKQGEQENHIRILLINGLITGSIMMCLTVSMLLIDKKIDVLRSQNEALKDETYSLKQEQKRLITKTPIKEYPKDGIGLKENPWDKLFEDSEKKSLQSEIETNLSEKVVPYFGLSTLVVSIDVPSKTLSVSLIGSVSYSGNKKTLLNNIEAFVKEAESISQLNQMHFEIEEVLKKGNTTVYSCTYGREDTDKPFELLNESNKGSKGE
ncbi:hypothetical protein [Enterococcus sp. DIV0800]|uniref:hypothetical protein n=1 Tax=Enterococcus sp. DIV0800 TaxID=2774646 RepID=UPI003D2FF403